MKSLLEFDLTIHFLPIFDVNVLDLMPMVSRSRANLHHAHEPSHNLHGVLLGLEHEKFPVDAQFAFDVFSKADHVIANIFEVGAIGGNVGGNVGHAAPAPAEKFIIIRRRSLLNTQIISRLKILLGLRKETFRQRIPTKNQATFVATFVPNIIANFFTVLNNGGLLQCANIPGTINNKFTT